MKEVLAALRSEEKRLEKELAHVRAVIAKADVAAKVDGRTKRGKRKGGKPGLKPRTGAEKVVAAAPVVRKPRAKKADAASVTSLADQKRQRAAQLAGKAPLTPAGV